MSEQLLLSIQYQNKIICACKYNVSPTTKNALELAVRFLTADHNNHQDLTKLPTIELIAYALNLFNQGEHLSKKEADYLWMSPILYSLVDLDSMVGPLGKGEIIVDKSRLLALFNKRPLMVTIDLFSKEIINYPCYQVDHSDEEELKHLDVINVDGVIDFAEFKAKDAQYILDRIDNTAFLTMSYGYAMIPSK